MSYHCLWRAKPQTFQASIALKISYLVYRHGSRPPWRNDHNDNRNRPDYNDRHAHDKYARRDDPKRHDDGFRNRHEHQRYHNQRPSQQNSGKEGHVSKHYPGDSRHGPVNRHDGSYGAKDRHDSSHYGSVNRHDGVSPLYGSMNRHESGSPHYGTINRHEIRSDSDHR